MSRLFVLFLVSNSLFSVLCEDMKNENAINKNRTVSIQKVLDAPSSKVWEALTDRQNMKDWYFDIPDFKPVIGQEFIFEGGPPEKIYIHLCKIVELVPGKKIAYTWRYEGYKGVSTVSFTLTPHGNKTQLNLEHKDLDSFPSDNPDLAIANFEAGWTELIDKLLPEYLANS